MWNTSGPHWPRQLEVNSNVTAESGVNEYELYVQDSDELGPGSDLVISMFALAMLVVGFIGSGFSTDGSRGETTAASAEAQLTQVEEAKLVLENRARILEQ